MFNLCKSSIFREQQVRIHLVSLWLINKLLQLPAPSLPPLCFYVCIHLSSILWKNNPRDSYMGTLCRIDFKNVDKATEICQNILLPWHQFIIGLKKRRWKKNMPAILHWVVFFFLSIPKDGGIYGWRRNRFWEQENKESSNLNNAYAKKQAEGTGNWTMGWGYDETSRGWFEFHKLRTNFALFSSRLEINQSQK